MVIKSMMMKLQNYPLYDENDYFDKRGNGPVGRGSRPPSAVASSRSSYLEMLEPISGDLLMI